jgi:hypothetical protein
MQACILTRFTSNLRTHLGSTSPQQGHRQLALVQPMQGWCRTPLQGTIGKVGKGIDSSQQFVPQLSEAQRPVGCWARSAVFCAGQGCLKGLVSMPCS